MASKETIKQVLYLFRSVTDFPIVGAKKDPATGEMIAPGTLEAWTLALADLTDQQVMAGGQYVLSTMTDDFKRRPMPGDIRKALAEAENKSWLEAWEEVQNRGYDILHPPFSSFQQALKSPQWSCPEIAAAIDQMGSLEFVLELNATRPAKAREQFKEIWQGVQQRKALQQLPAMPKLPALPAPAVPTAPQIAAPMAPDQAQALLLEAAETDNVIDFQRAAQVLATAEHKRVGLQDLRRQLEEIEARRREQKQARKVEQQSLIRKAAEMQGIELQTFDLPEVLP